MLSFASDYTEGAHPKLLERLAERNLVPLQGYGADPDTEAIVLIGEIGGAAEETAAAWAGEHLAGIPKAAFIAGRTAPEGKRMGHAGAIISGGKGTAASKVEALEAAGFRVAGSPTELPQLLRDAGYRG